jgi:hypothetical protein
MTSMIITIVTMLPMTITHMKAIATAKDVLTTRVGTAKGMSVVVDVAATVIVITIIAVIIAIFL